MPEQQICLREVENVTLMSCDDGLKMVFIPKEGEALSITMPWSTAADMAIRLDQLGQEALLMTQAGLNPYRESHRVSFLTAQLQVACDGDQTKGPGA
jgi:hypothetical protein